MSKHVEFLELRALLSKAFETALRGFAGTVDNREVFAVVLSFDWFSGRVQLAVNTEPGYRSVVADTYSSWSKEKLESFGGVRFSAGDFAHPDIARLPGQFDAWQEAFEQAQDDATEEESNRLIAELEATLVDVARDLEPVLDSLDRTPQFACWVAHWAATRGEQLALMRRTVSAEQILRTFPQFSTVESIRDRLARLPKEEAAAALVRAILGMHGVHADDLARQLMACHLDPTEVEAWLVGFSGQCALAEVFGAARALASAPEFTESGSAERESRGAFTSENHAYSSMMRVVEDVGRRDGSVRRSLEELLETLLLKAGESEPVIGTNLLVTAQVMWALWPAHYPEPVLDGHTNRILNSENFLR